MVEDFHGVIRPSYMDQNGRASIVLSDFDLRVRRSLGTDFENLEEGNLIKTYLRIRPGILQNISTNTSNASKTEPSSQPLFVLEDTKTVVFRPPQRNNLNNGGIVESRFSFTRVFGAESNQVTIFDECAVEVLNNFFRGQNGLIFCYGGTNSGKTYTMQGYGRDFGLVPRTLELIFSQLEESLYKKDDIKPTMHDSCIVLDPNTKRMNHDIKHRILQQSKIKPSEVSTFLESFTHSARLGIGDDTSKNPVFLDAGSNETLNTNCTLPDKEFFYSIWVSFSEIYNDRVYDLFDTVRKGKRRRELKIYQDKQNRVYVKELTECSVNSAAEAYQFFLAGKQNLQFAATNVNYSSSRSHSFFNIRMVKIGKAGDTIYPIEVCRLTFCDLAGLERLSQTGNVGVRLKESGNINQSLMVLVRCIRGLREQQNGLKNEMIPFRDSKLTRLFQGYLLTATQISMIVNVNPDPSMIETTIQVIQNSATASAIRTFKKIEAPCNESTFYKKVRKSLGLPDKGLVEDLSEQSPDVVTVKRKTVVSATEQIQALQREVVLLRRHIGELKYKARDEVEEEYDELIYEQREQYEKMMATERKTLIAFSEHNLALAVEVFNPLLNHNSYENKNEYNDKIRNGENEIQMSPTPPRRPLRPLASPEGNINAKYRSIIAANERLKGENEELTQTVIAYQDVTTKKNKDLEYSRTTIKQLEALLDQKNNELLKQNVTISELTSSVTTLEVEFLNAKVKELTDELTQAEELCVDYHQKLEGANERIKILTEEVNDLHHKYFILTQDNEMLHVLIDELQNFPRH